MENEDKLEICSYCSAEVNEDELVCCDSCCEDICANCEVSGLCAECDAREYEENEEITDEEEE